MSTFIFSVPALITEQHVCTSIPAAAERRHRHLLEHISPVLLL